MSHVGRRRSSVADDERRQKTSRHVAACVARDALASLLPVLLPILCLNLLSLTLTVAA